MTVATLYPTAVVSFVSFAMSGTPTAAQVNSVNDATYWTTVNDGAGMAVVCDFTAPADFDSLNAQVTVTVRVALSTALSDDTYTITGRMVNSSGTAIGAFTPSTRTVTSTTHTDFTFTSVGWAPTKTVLEDARFHIDNGYSKNMGGDGVALRVSRVSATVDYSAGVTEVFGTATAAVGVTATATGVATKFGVATAAIGVTASASGVATKFGVGTASIGVTASATGVATKFGVGTAAIGVTATATGTASTPGGGVTVKLDNGTAWVAATVYIDNGTSWVPATLKLDDGAAWTPA